MTTTHPSAPPLEPPAGGWRVPFVRPDLPGYGEIEPSFRRIVETGLLTKGCELRRLEDEVRELTGAAHAIAVSSCTVGLSLGLRALRALQEQAGMRLARSQVVLPSFTFLAAPAAVVWAGLEPVFVDCDPQTWTVSPTAVEAAIGPHTAAVLACHTFGCPCDLAALEAIADQAGVPLMIDAAHGFGTLVSGRQVGGEGFAQVFSMSPTKLVVAGEGGVVCTSSASFAESIREQREYGNDGHYGCTVAGLNGRLPELSAALGRASLARLDGVRTRRAAVAEAYGDALTDIDGIGLQSIPAGSESSWKDFSLTIDPGRFGADRDAVMEHLAARGIDTRAYYSPPCHRMTAFSGLHPVDRRLPVTDRLSATIVSLPMGSHVTPAIAREVAAEIIAARS